MCCYHFRQVINVRVPGAGAGWVSRFTNYTALFRSISGFHQNAEFQLKDTIHLIIQSWDEDMVEPMGARSLPPLAAPQQLPGAGERCKPLICQLSARARAAAASLQLVSHP